jgi:hypothetical protein
MKMIEDARPVFFALSQKTLALCFLWRCGDEDEMEDFAPLRLSAELVFCAVSFLLFLEAGEVRVFVWHVLSPDAEQELVAARGVVALLVLVVVVVVVLLAAPAVLQTVFALAL